MQKQRLAYLLEQYSRDIATLSEMEELSAYLRGNDGPELFSDTLSGLMERHPASASELAYLGENHDLPDKALALDKDMNIKPPSSTPAHRVHFPGRRLFWYGAAAAVLVFLGTGLYFWTGFKKNTGIAVVTPVPALNDINPGGDKALLTLADGTTIVLDNAANGSLAQQGNTSVVKLANGQLVYRSGGAVNGEVAMNTMSTPRGGQYRLILPDGTKVWLNAASSITFPTAFVKGSRKVAVKGEAYLEVITNREKPFVVDVDGKSVIEVLGTDFNVNSYAEETGIKTTLIEGSVGVAAAGQKVVIQPGQQAVVENNKGVFVAPHVDLDQVLAWKNGIFNFENLSFQEAARQLERWYDIEVVYEGKAPSIQFKGDMNRGIPLSGVLRIFSAFGVKTRIEGKKLVVM